MVEMIMIILGLLLGLVLLDYVSKINSNVNHLMEFQKSLLSEVRYSNSSVREHFYKFSSDIKKTLNSKKRERKKPVDK